MKPVDLRKARFLLSAVDPSQFPRHRLPEVALVGRSNVGKSSLINALAGQRLARAAARPGRTRTLNFYEFDGRLCLVDLPGYGYAEAPQAERARWEAMIQGYLTGRENLRGAVLVLDARHAPTESDLLAATYLSEQGLSLLAVATKADKLGRSEQLRRQAEMARAMGQPVLLFSARTGEGRDSLVRALLALAGLR